MIQRIQTVWLFLAAVITAATLYFPIFKLANDSLLGLEDNYIGILLVAAAALLSLFTLFSFKKRSLQLKLIWLNVLLILGLLVFMFFTIDQARTALPSPGGAYRLGAFVPIVSLVFLFLARAGIRKDIKLLKAYDRLR